MPETPMPDDFVSTLWPLSTSNSRFRDLNVALTSTFGGAEGTRTLDPLHAMQVRYQLRHSPKVHRSGPTPPAGRSESLGENLARLLIRH